MKSIFILVVFIFTLQISKAQFGCSPSTLPDETFMPNSVNTSTNTLLIQYLCGPNTILYDTTVSFCHRVYVENNCTLIFRPKCVANDHIWLKSNSILNILNYFGDITIHVESGAVINHAPSPMYSFSIDTCSNIIYPYINCTTGLLTRANEIKVDIYPNPVNKKLTITSDEEIQKLEIISSVGQLFLFEKINTKSHQLQLQDFEEGIYFIKVIYANGQSVTKKLVKQN